MKVRTVRLVVLVTVFLLVVGAVYFVFIPPSYLQLRFHGHGENASFLHELVHLLSSHRPKSKAAGPSAKLSSVVLANTSAAVQLAKEMHRRKGVILFTMINDAFFDFAASWCCNTALFDDLHQRVLFLTSDPQTGQRLQALWPNISVVAMGGSQFQGSQEYSKAGYVRMMTERTRFILHLVEAGVEVLLFEVDCVWLRNPLPLVLAHHSQADILATKVSGKDVTAGGFLLLRPTVATVSFWRQLALMMDQLDSRLKARKDSATVSEAMNDQEFFSSLARKRYAGIKIVYLPSQNFPDGKWYSLPEQQRQKSQPLIINNNWVVGTAAKRRRAKVFGHWFWDESERKCNSSAVHGLRH